MKKKLLGSILLGLALTLGCAATALADARKVVTLGQDLSQDQMNTMMRYFGVSYDEVDLIYINNQQEREQLGAYVPLEQIGSHTYSCALVAPTSSGGIQVKTANLTWVTCNMIASTLSTSGVTNCQVVAAAPFKVSGTGALTGVIMAYEQASKQVLEPQKVELANQELVTTGNLSNEVGQSKATAIINETKTQVIENNITNIEEITNIVNNVSNEYDVTINEDQSAEIADLMQKIAEQDYDITQLKATLDRVQANVVGDAGASEEKVAEAQEQAAASEQAAKEAAQEQAEQSTEAGDDGITIIEGESEEETEVDILNNTDSDALGTDINEGDTTTTVQEQATEAETEAETNEFGIPEATNDGTMTENTGDTAEATTEAAGDGGDTDTGIIVDNTEATGATEATETTEAAEAENTEATEAVTETEATVTLDEEDQKLYDEVKTDLDTTFQTATITAEDGTQVWLDEDAAKKIPETVEAYVKNVLANGVQAVQTEEAADPQIDQNIMEETQDQAPDKNYEDEDLKQIDKFVRRMVFKDSEDLLTSSMLEDTDKPVLYNAIMSVLEKAYKVEDTTEELTTEATDAALTSDATLGDTETDTVTDDGLTSSDGSDEFAGFDEEVGTF